MNNEKVFLGVSGGIDSAASLVVLKDKGFDVTGVYLFMRGETPDKNVMEQLNEISSKTGVEIIVYDVRERFQRCVVEPFIEKYMMGETPSPCAECNPLIKWQSLIEVADSHGGGCIATGHYCRVTQQNGHYYLQKGIDPLKDQSYYMWQLPQRVLKRACFPLGEMTKSDVRNFMSRRGFELMTNRRESMGVCFFEGKKCSQWLLENGVARCRGEVVDVEGNVVGEHDGYPFYTIAQKKGFKLFNDSKGLSVIDVDCEKNQLTVGDSNILNSKVLYLKNWVIAPHDDSENITIKVRGVGVNPNGFCRLEHDGEFLKVTLLNDTAWALTKGQPAVFYVNERLIGGGIVDKWLNTIV